MDKTIMMIHGMIVAMLLIVACADVYQPNVENQSGRNVNNIENTDNYVDVEAVRCPSSFNSETGRFRDVNFWIFQRKENDDQVSRVLRPNRDTGTWRADVFPGDHMLVTMDSYVWISRIYDDSINVFDRQRLIMERKFVERRSIESRCEAVPVELARTTVAEEY